MSVPTEASISQLTALVTGSVLVWVFELILETCVRSQPAVLLFGNGASNFDGEVRRHRWRSVQNRHGIPLSPWDGPNPEVTADSVRRHFLKRLPFHLFGGESLSPVLTPSSCER
jgi:hypothetical protein